MLRIRLAVLLAERKMNVADLHRITGIRYNTLNDYKNEMALSIRLEHIDKICYALNCTPADLFGYERTPPCQYD